MRRWLILGFALSAIGCMAAITRGLSSQAPYAFIENYDWRPALPEDGHIPEGFDGYVFEARWPEVQKQADAELVQSGLERGGGQCGWDLSEYYSYPGTLLDPLVEIRPDLFQSIIDRGKTRVLVLVKRDIPGRSVWTKLLQMLGI